MRNEKFAAHLTPGNGTGRLGGADHHPDKKQERARNLKFAIFYLAVGILLFLANQFAKQPTAERNQPNALTNVGLVLSVSNRPEPTVPGIGRTGGATYAVRFQLSNRGNQSIFYSVYQGTNRPTGHLVYRVAPRSEWIVPSWPKESTSTSAGASIGGKVAWVEMPPGGWVDGVYDDPGSPGVDHAYQLDLKVAADGNVVRFISQAYRLSAD